MQNIEHGYSLESHVEGEPRLLDSPRLRLDLGADISELRRSEAFVAHGHVAKTLVKYPDLRVVLVVMREGARLGEHPSRARLTLQTVEGRVRLKLPDQMLELPQGHLFALDHSVRHDVLAEEDSAVLLTLTWPPVE